MSFTHRFAVAALAACAVASSVANAGTFTTLYAFTGGNEGGNPIGQLLFRRGALYGTTPANVSHLGFDGNVFKVSVATGAFRVVYTFNGGDDGSGPAAGVIYHDGMLYGTTLFGGGPACDCGTIFAIDIKTRAERVLYSFGNGGNFSPASPGALVYVAGTLYGTTGGQGASDNGSVFSFNPAAGAFATLYSFAKGKDGADPNPTLLYKNGLLYGTTVYGGGGPCQGGSDGCGTVFAINPVTGSETLLHAFSSFAAGEYPQSNLIYYSGLLEGDTSRGGVSPPCKYGCGVSFAISVATGAETILDKFSNRKATYAALTLRGGADYETLGEGGGHGKLIKVDRKSGKQITLYKFTGGADGDDPEAPLTYQDGVLYGSTFRGGKYGYGTIFKYVP